MIKKIKYVFLKAKTQYNYKHYFKLGCYIYLLVSYNITYGYICWFRVLFLNIYIYIYNHLNEFNTKTNYLNIKIRNKN